MTKRVFALLICLLLGANAAQATILPASGTDEGFRAWTGLEATTAVVLCESLTVYDARGDQGGRPVDTLYYTGTSTVPVLESWDGWARVYYGAEQYYGEPLKTGWVRNEYLLFDPAWYLCDESTPVYAYPDGMAPRVALLDAGECLPILTDYRDAVSISGWVCVSLRGAAGWIRKTPKDTADETWFRPYMLEDIGSAVLMYGGAAIGVSDPDAMAALSALLTSAEDLGAEMAGCPFGAELELHLADGSVITLAVATDSCCVYRVDGRDYKYARSLRTDPESSVDNAVLLEVFGLDTWEDAVTRQGNG